MQLSGQRLFHSSPEQIWELLMDPEVLARIIPGIDTLELTGEHQYKAISKIKMGPVNGTFKGNIQIEDREPFNHFKLLANQESKIGQATAIVHIELLQENNASTKILFAGEAKLTGFLARMGQRLLSGVSNSLTGQFFNNLEKELQIDQNT